MPQRGWLAGSVCLSIFLTLVFFRISNRNILQSRDLNAQSSNRFHRYISSQRRGTRHHPSTNDSHEYYKPDNFLQQHLPPTTLNASAQQPSSDRHSYITNTEQYQCSRPMHLHGVGNLTSTEFYSYKDCKSNIERETIMDCAGATLENAVAHWHQENVRLREQRRTWACGDSLVYLTLQPRAEMT